jgi:hypothetical protein
MHSLHRYTPPQWSTPFIILLLMHNSITLLPSHPLIYQHRSAKTCKSKQDIRGKARENWYYLIQLWVEAELCIFWVSVWIMPVAEGTSVMNLHVCNSVTPVATLHNHHLSTRRGCLAHVPFSSCSWLENWWLGSGARPFSCNLIIRIQLQHCITWGFHTW